MPHNKQDVTVLFRQICVFCVLVAGVGIFITSFNLLNNFVIKELPGFPVWLLPLVSSAIAVAVGFYIWNKFREGELLKYEFINVVTHKFNPPLTHIKWAWENLALRPRTEDAKAQLSYIKTANLKLMELTELLVAVSESESSTYHYTFIKKNISQSAEAVITALKTQFNARAITVTKDIGDGIQANIDENRIRFVMQTFIENAINYSPQGGTIVITLRQENGTTLFTVKDSGIGIDQEELPLLFTKFYRGKKAKLTDTEGMGIGLYISKEIILHHKGKIWAESPGESMGSTFSFSLPGNN